MAEYSDVKPQDDWGHSTHGEEDDLSDYQPGMGAMVAMGFEAFTPSVPSGYPLGDFDPNNDKIAGDFAGDFMGAETVAQEYAHDLKNWLAGHPGHSAEEYFKDWHSKNAQRYRHDLIAWRARHPNGTDAEYHAAWLREAGGMHGDAMGWEWGGRRGRLHGAWRDRRSWWQRLWNRPIAPVVPVTTAAPPPGMPVPPAPQVAPPADNMGWEWHDRPVDIEYGGGEDPGWRRWQHEGWAHHGYGRRW